MSRVDDSHDDKHIDVQSSYSAAQNHSRHGRLAEAIAEFLTALSDEPDHVKARLGRGLALQRVGEHAAAIRDFTEVIERHGEWAGAYAAYYGRAYSQSALGGAREVVADCNEALQRNPDHADSLYARGAAWKQLGRLELAAEDLTSALELEPTYHEAYYTRATVCFMQGRWESAIEDFTAFLCHPSRSGGSAGDCYRFRGIAAFELGRYEAAIADLSVAIEHNPSDGTIYLRRSQVYAAISKSQEAEGDFKRGTSLLSIPGNTAREASTSGSNGL